jgi:hypothetical protein
MKTTWILCLSLCIAGCASYADREHADRLSLSASDDDYCASHGPQYPDPGYVQCRRELVDKRLYRQWKSAQLMNGAGPTTAPRPALQDDYRAPDPAAFHCHPEPQFGGKYVFCGYDGPTSDGPPG